MSKITQKILRAKRIAAGLCTRCNGTVIPGKQMCLVCLDKFRQTRNNKKDLGMCSACLHTLAIENRKMCQGCIDKAHNKYNPKVESTYRKKLQVGHKELGLCIKCTNPRKETSVYCEECTNALVSRSSKRRMDNIVKELCAKCGKNPPKFGRVECEACIEKRHTGYISNKENRATKNKIKYQELQDKVYVGYGDKCKCCSGTNRDYFTIDHVNNDGAEHRKIIGRGNLILLQWLIDNNFPEGFQILCANCHLVKTRGITCSH
jgi:hypothetical protein